MTASMTAPGRRKAKAKICETCSGKNGQHVAACPDRPERCTVELDGERCGKDAGHLKEPHESKTTGGALTWGYPYEDDTETDSSEAIAAVVDGAEAQVVLDGASGAPMQPELITTSLEDRVRSISQKRAQLIEAELDKKRVSERVKTIQGELKDMVDGLVAQVDGRDIPLPAFEALIVDDPQPTERFDPKFSAMAQEMQSTAGGDDEGDGQTIRGLGRGRAFIESASNEGPED